MARSRVETERQACCGDEERLVCGSIGDAGGGVAAGPVGYGIQEGSWVCLGKLSVEVGTLEQIGTVIGKMVGAGVGAQVGKA